MMHRPESGGSLGKCVGRSCSFVLVFGVLCALATASPGANATPSCTRDTGPLGIDAAQWSDADKAPQALARHGFGTVAFASRDGTRLTAQLYRPSRFDAANGPVWFVMHGVNRDAARYIAAAAPVAERHQALAIAIEFSRRDYPSSEDYTLGINANSSSTSAAAAREGRWRAPDRYLYNEIERVFEALRRSVGGAQRGYYLFGHSAGAQFTHRLLTFVPCARVLGAVAANAGWYTLPVSDPAQRFSMPYTLRGGPAQNFDARPLLAAPLTLLLGTRDISDSKTDSNVRDTPAAMAQGPNRLTRGRHYFETGQALARSIGAPFEWRLALAPGAGHDVRQVIASAGNLLFAANAKSLCTASEASQADQLVFTEVLADPPPGPAGDVNRDGERQARGDEFVELVNAGATALCLSGWTLEDASGRGKHLFGIGSSLVPGKAVVVFGGGVPNGSFGGADVQVATSAKGLDLDAAGDVLTLRDAKGAIVKRLSWGNCAAQQCVADHWRGDLRLNGSIVRAPAPDSRWQVHRDVAGTPYSPGVQSSGKAP